MSEIYVSHISTNDAMATRISFALRDAGIGTWIDHIHGSEFTVEEAQEAIQRCQSGLFILSEDSLYSRKCAHEWQAILDQKKPLYVVLLETVPSDDLPTPLWDRSIPYIDLTFDVDHGLDKLVRAIAGTTTRN
jgi:hypothetical protein